VRLFARIEHQLEVALFEALEKRQLFAYVPGTFVTQLVTAQLSNGTLAINGSTGHDNVRVRLVNSNVEVTAFGGTLIVHVQQPWPTYTDWTKTFPAASVNDIVVNLKGGNDRYLQELPWGSTQVHGGPGNDAIRGRLGGYRHEANAYGEEGNDLLEIDGQFCWADGGAGADTIRAWNPGVDMGCIADYAARTNAVIVDMNSAGGDGESGEGDTIDPSCFGVRGGSGDDLIVGGFDPAGQYASGEGRYYGSQGNDTVWGGSGFDMIFGGDGDDELHSGPAAASGLNNDQVFGEGGNDTLVGTGNGEVLNGGAGDNVIDPDGDA
jgi:Ca2+-binding RTX toxin-like protein